LKLAAK